MARGKAYQGRGKTFFREYSKIVNQTYRLIVKAIVQGNEFFSNEIEDQFNQVYLAFQRELVDQEVPNKEIWEERLSILITNRITEIYDKFGEPEEQEPEPEVEEPDESPRVDEENGVITIRGDDYPIITRENAPTMRRAGRSPRNRVFSSLDELENYLYKEEWPREYIQLYGGIEILKRGSRVVGYRIWIG